MNLSLELDCVLLSVEFIPGTASLVDPTYDQGLNAPWLMETWNLGKWYAVFISFLVHSLTSPMEKENNSKYVT